MLKTTKETTAFNKAITNFAEEIDLTSSFDVILNTTNCFVAIPKKPTSECIATLGCNGMLILDQQKTEFIGRYYNLAVVLLDNKLICRPL